MTPYLKVNYFINPSDVSAYTAAKLTQLDRTAESNFVRLLRVDCDNEVSNKQRMYDAAAGWFFYQDPDKLAAAEAYAMPSCDRLHSMGVSR